MVASFFAIDVPATSANLGPGFDTFGVALQLYNKFLFRILESSPNELIFRANFPLKQNIRSNLVYRAFCYTLECLECKVIPGVEISVLSQIPSARGLGSSASAVVAGVLAGGAITGTNFRLSEVVELATQVEGHPDNVAPAILGGMVICAQENNFIYTQKIDWPEELAILVGIPNTKLRTESSRKALAKRVLFEDAVYNLSRSALFIGSLYRKDWRGLSLAMQDRLHQPARASLVPGLARIMKATLEVGAIGTVLSGSGPSILSVVPVSEQERIESIGRVMQEVWKSMNIQSEVKILLVQRSTTKIKTIDKQEFDALSVEVLEGEEIS
ncbi:MAG: homoserine kinase [Candidatus Caenarcaniphilales bacterium]|nr:homoserine kinase [Candidatus Caenarcaniphilales bacterium]